jgi:hypothetical protein
MAIWTELARTPPELPDWGGAEVEELVSGPADEEAALESPATVALEARQEGAAMPAALAPPASPKWHHGWPIPSSICTDPDQARACIHLPEFGADLIERARVVSSRMPFAEAEYRHTRRARPNPDEPEISHFERVFRIAARLGGIAKVEETHDYDALLILTAWHSVRPGVEGFPAAYPKALLCPLSHTAPPSALAELPPAKYFTFERRVPYYLRYLLCEKFGLRTCWDIENADLRHLLRSAGFRLIRPSAVPGVAFPGCTHGDDPPIRPWKLTLRQELSDERAATMLMQAALWKIQYDLRLVTVDRGLARWNIGAFAETDWEDAFLSLGVRVAPSLLRKSGLFDWRGVLSRCVEQIGRGNLPREVLGQVSAWPQRICHDDRQAIWEVLDRTATQVVERARTGEPQLFGEEGRLNYDVARSFRGWARLFDEISPQILSRLGVSAFTALRRVAPDHFGWRSTQLKPWELEQEFGKWKGPRGRVLLRSAYAFALFEEGLGCIYNEGEQAIWQCHLAQFPTWYAQRITDGVAPYDFLYGLAARHGLTPLLNREMTHTAAVSLLAGIQLHQDLPSIEGCWEVCMRSALEHHGGVLEVRLSIPDLAPLPLRLRKAVLTPLTYGYLHKELRLVRDFDLRLAREAHRQLAEIPGWWEDERVVGTPLHARLEDPADPARAVLARLHAEPWLEPPAQKIRFRALNLLVSPRAAVTEDGDSERLTSEEIRALLHLALEGTLSHTNVVHVSFPAIQSGFARLLAREDTREVVDSLLLHVGAAYETEIWGKVRRFLVLDVINDLLALTIRYSLLHLMSSE